MSYLRSMMEPLMRSSPVCILPLYIGRSREGGYIQVFNKLSTCALVMEWSISREFFFVNLFLIIFLHTGMKSAAYRPADYRRNTLRGSSVSSLEEVSRTLKRTKDPYSASRPWLKWMLLLLADFVIILFSCCAVDLLFTFDMYAIFHTHIDHEIWIVMILYDKRTLVPELGAWELDHG